MASNLYKGFSTFEYQKNKTFNIVDIELVKLDLLNHIFTRKGERVMMPSFGTQIPDLVFEPLDEFTTDTMEEELRRVFDYDPRVKLLEFTLEPQYDTNSVSMHAKLLYLELNIVDTMNLNIEFEGAG